MADRKRRRWRVLVPALVVWVGTFLHLWWYLPARPRLSFMGPTAGMNILDVTENDRFLITISAVVDPDSGIGYPGWSGPIKRWDLTIGHGESFYLADKTQVPARGAFPGGVRDADWWKNLIVWKVAIASRGQAIAYECATPASKDASVRLLSLATGRELLCLRDTSLGSSNFSPNGQWFAVRYGNAGARYASVRLFESSTGREIILGDPNHIPEQLLEFCFSPDSRFFAATLKIAKQWHTYVWDISKREQIAKVEGWNYILALSPGGQTLAAVQQQSVKLIDVATGQTRLELEDHRHMFTALAFSPDGRHLSAFDDHIINGKSLNRATTWDAATGRLLKRFDPPDSTDPSIEGFICVDPNDSSTPRIVVQYDKNDWKVFDVLTGEQLGSWPTSQKPVRVSPDGKILATHEKVTEKPNGIWPWIKENLLGSPATDEEISTLQLWDLPTGRSLASYGGYNGICRFSADSNKLIAQKDSGAIDIWDLPPRSPIGRILAWSVVPVLLVLGIACLRRRLFEARVRPGSQTVDRI